MLIKFIADAVNKPTLLILSEENPNTAVASFKALSQAQRDLLSRRSLPEIQAAVAKEIEHSFSLETPGARYPHTQVISHGLEPARGPAEFFLNIEFKVTPEKNPQQLLDIRGHFDLTLTKQSTGSDVVRATKYIESAIYDFTTKQVTVKMKVMFPSHGKYDLEIWGKHFATIKKTGAFEAVNPAGQGGGAVPQ